MRKNYTVLLATLLFVSGLSSTVNAKIGNMKKAENGPSLNVENLSLRTSKVLIQHLLKELPQVEVTSVLTELVESGELESLSEAELTRLNGQVLEILACGSCKARHDII